MARVGTPRPQSARSCAGIPVSRPSLVSWPCGGASSRVPMVSHRLARRAARVCDVAHRSMVHAKLRYHRFTPQRTSLRGERVADKEMLGGGTSLPTSVKDMGSPSRWGGRHLSIITTACRHPRNPQRGNMRTSNGRRQEAVAELYGGARGRKADDGADVPITSREGSSYIIVTEIPETEEGIWRIMRHRLNRREGRLFDEGRCT